MTHTEALKNAAQNALGVLDEARTYTSSEAWSPSMTEECDRAIRLLTAALAAPSVPSGEPADRAAFEAYFADSRRSKGPSKRPTFARLPDDTYADDHTQRHWWTWQQSRAAPQPAPAGWRPIETAPKDGTALLVMRDIWPGTASGRAEECNGHNTYVAEWWESEGSDRRGRWVCYMDAVYDPTCPIVPTHWMPLPAAPGGEG
jgi:hypothetical protein